MAIKLTRGRPKARCVEIDAGSDVEPIRKPVALWLRPATYPESIEAAERISPMIVALREGSDAAAEIASLLGEEFAGVVVEPAKLAAAAQKLALMELVALCCERVEGELLDDQDRPIGEVDAAIAGLLVRDPVIARKLRDVIEGPLYEVLAEKNGLAASPSGGAAARTIAPNVEQPALPAPAAGAD
jgi:hypothetical protein